MEGTKTKHFSDCRKEKDVVEENKLLLKDIVRHCNRSDYKKHRLLLIGDVASGKSSTINTILKVIIGRYIPRARIAQEDEGPCTLQFKCFPNCGARHSDFEDISCQRSPSTRNDEEQEQTESVDAEILKSFRTVLEKLPDIFDTQGIAVESNERCKELLRLYLGGFVPPNTNITNLVCLQSIHRLGHLPWILKRARDDCRVTKVLFVHSCTRPFPRDLMKCVQEVLAEVDKNTLTNKYDADLYVLTTNYDKMSNTDETKDEDKDFGNEMNRTNKSSEQTKEDADTKRDPKWHRENKSEISSSFSKEGMTEHSTMNWISFNEVVGYDNVYIDNKVLKLLKVLTTPTHKHELPVESRNWVLVCFCSICVGLLVAFLCLCILVKVALFEAHIELGEGYEKLKVDYDNLYQRCSKYHR